MKTREWLADLQAHGSDFQGCARILLERAERELQEITLAELAMTFQLAMATFALKPEDARALLSHLEKLPISELVPETPLTRLRGEISRMQEKEHALREMSEHIEEIEGELSCAAAASAQQRISYEEAKNRLQRLKSRQEQIHGAFTSFSDR